MKRGIEALASDYAKLFQVPGASYVHPWESPYVGKESMVFQESTLDVRSFYHEAGFKLRAEKHFPDDHIAAMMDYLGRTSARTRRTPTGAMARCARRWPCRGAFWTSTC